MEKKNRHSYIRSLMWFLVTGFMLAGFGVASIVDTTGFVPPPAVELDHDASAVLGELDSLGLLKGTPQPAIERLLTHQKKTGMPLSRIIKDPRWQAELGLASSRFKSTWYAANPFDLLPPDLQMAIKQKKIPMRSRAELEQWCRQNRAPKLWIQAFKTALRETTPANLARAAEGKRPYAKNGELLEPIVIENAKGKFEVRNGHIATDPRIIPTNTYVLMLVKVNGKETLLRVKATDIGGAIRGQHVDLPIQFRRKSDLTLTPHIHFPKEYIRNPTVTIIYPKKVNRGQKV